MSEGNEWVTIAEAARRLDATEPRLRRLLQREDFSQHTRQEERKTRTGTRTGIVVSVSVLSDLRTALEKGTAPKPERKQEQEQPEALALLSSAMDRVLQEKDTRIEELKRALEHERETNRRLMDALQREQSLRLLSPAPPDTPTTAPDATDSAQTTPGVGDDSIKNCHLAKINKDLVGDDRPRRWWQFWR